MDKGASKVICVVVNSRANYGRSKTLLAALKAHPRIDLKIIVGASALLYRFGRAIDLIREDGFEVDATLYSIVEGETPATMAKSTGLAIVELSTIFENIQPDVVLTIADRFETLATAVAASYMNIPLAHTQGGEVTGSIDESVRHAITKLSHIHFPATRLACKRLEQMGEEPNRIHLVGCPSIDIIAGVDLSIEDDFFNKAGTGASIDPRTPFLVVLQHPVTTEYGYGFSQIRETLDAVESVGLQVVWLWPNVDAGSDDISKALREYKDRTPTSKIRFYRNFSPVDYGRLINNCSCLVGNSSSGIREGSYLGVPVVNIGSRQFGRETGPNVVHAGYHSSEIKAAIIDQIKVGRYLSSDLYGKGHSGELIAEILDTARIDINKRLTYAD